jgi:dTDP-4-dehydrorhamnose reductase
MKVVVTGANGQLGQDLVRIIGDLHKVVGLGRSDLDIRDLDECKKIIRQLKPDVIIHAAAYTAVDLAESDEDEAYSVNAYGSRNMAVAAEESGAKLCLISTDYVFDGNATSPYKEHDQTNPQGVYGKSKLAGEQLVQSLSSRFFIVRTSWVYGQYGNNFVKTMLKLSKERDQLMIVNDQVGSPTYTVDLSKFLLDLIETDNFGIYHASNSGHCSWYEFAKAIFTESGINVQVEPCTSGQFPRPAPRPSYSVMDHLAIRSQGFADLRPWREALQEFLGTVKE